MSGHPVYYLDQIPGIETVESREDFKLDLITLLFDMLSHIKERNTLSLQKYELMMAVVPELNPTLHHEVNQKRLELVEGINPNSKKSISETRELIKNHFMTEFESDRIPKLECDLNTVDNMKLYMQFFILKFAQDIAPKLVSLYHNI